jgi:hypothetical protein
MAEDPDPRQLHLEAKRSRRNQEQLGVTSTPEAGDRVLSQPREAYRPPSFLRKIALPGEVAELAGILDELWSVNEEHVGEIILEVEAYYALTGRRRDITERLIAWCRRFFEQRSDPGRPNPKDRGDPYLRFERLLKEFNDILGPVSNRAGTMSFVFIPECSAFVTWYLFDRTWGKSLHEGPDGQLSLGFVSNRADIRVHCYNYMSACRLHLRDLGLFLRRVREATGCRDRSEKIRGFQDDALRAGLDRLAADIQEMRPFLLRGFRAEKASISLGDDLVVAWDWSLLYGIAYLIPGTTIEDIQRAMVTRSAQLIVTVGRDGLLLDANNPWVTTGTIAARDGDRWLPENFLVLELMHEKLFGLYDRIDFERIRCRSGVAEGDADDEAIALSVRDLAATEADDGTDESHDEPGPAADRPPAPRRIRPLRSRRLLTFLEKRFGCEVRPGKGSEVTVYRPGGRIFTLGHHGSNDEVSSVVVAHLLKRLAIGLDEWRLAVSR